MSRIRSWVGNMTFWFQTKRNESHATKDPLQNDPPQNTSHPLSRSILEIMNKPTDKAPASKHKP